MEQLINKHHPLCTCESCIPFGIGDRPLYLFESGNLAQSPVNLPDEIGQGTPFNFRTRPILSAVQQHHILFYSPVLDRLVLPFAVQTSLPFNEFFL